jgi:ribosomal protein L34E
MDMTVSQSATMPPITHNSTVNENLATQTSTKADVTKDDAERKTIANEDSKASKKMKPEPIQSSVSATVCSNCGTTTTPLWRRAPNGETICNACGLYLKARNTLRPVSLKRLYAKKSETTNDCGSGAGAAGGSCPGGGHCNGTGGSSSCAGCPAYNQHQVNRQALICANCQTTTTPLWRRDEANNTICNACGLYYKLHNVHRPVTMKRSTIKRRKRVAITTASEKASDEEDDLESETALSVGDSHNNEGHHSDRTATEEEDSDNTPGRKRNKNHAGKKVKRIRKGNQVVEDGLAVKEVPHVPAIEDYIVPRRLPEAIDYRVSSVTSHFSHNGRDAHYHPPLESRHSTSPFSSHSRAHDIRSVRLPHEQPLPMHMRSVSPFNAPFSSDKHFSTLPPVSAERRSSHGIASLLNPTPSNEQLRSSHLPPISLPPLTPPITTASSTTSAVSRSSPRHEFSPPSKFPSLLTSAFTSSVERPELTSKSEELLKQHKKELQAEISNLGLLLTKRTAMLSSIDDALTSHIRPKAADSASHNRM